MEHCPACKAPFKGRPICHRCKTDLGPLIAAADRATACLGAAHAAFKRNDYREAWAQAGRSLAMKHSGEAEALHRYAGLLAGTTALED